MQFSTNVKQSKKFAGDIKVAVSPERRGLPVTPCADPENPIIPGTYGLPDGNLHRGRTENQS